MSRLKELRALKGKFAPLWYQKKTTTKKQQLKVAFDPNHLIGLFEDNPRIQYWHLFYFYRCYGNKNGHQNRLKIGKLPFWTRF